MVTPLCLRCKGGKLLCGKSYCPMLSKVNEHLPRTSRRTDDIFGSSPPSVFVGRFGYPKVALGPMLPMDIIPGAGRLDEPWKWVGKSIEEILGLRAALVRSKHDVRVERFFNPDRVVDATQEVAMSSKPVDTEVFLTKPVELKPKIQFREFAAPTGQSVEIRKVDVTENPRVPRKVDAVVSDTDALGADGVEELFSSNISQYHITRLLSVGLLGRSKYRKLVPTRWSITAIDDIVGKKLIDEIKDYPAKGDIEVYRSHNLGNHFQILLIPRIWSFEVIETWLRGAMWADEHSLSGLRPKPLQEPPVQIASAVDFERYEGRKDYASNVTGGYYAARTPVLEFLAARRRQATAVVVRDITDDYWAPLGVWVVRETTRTAFDNPPERFDNLQAAVDSVNAHTRNRGWLKNSVMLKELLVQRTLDDYF